MMIICVNIDAGIRIFQNMSCFIYDLIKTKATRQNINSQYYSIGAVIKIPKIQFSIKTIKNSYQIWILFQSYHQNKTLNCLKTFQVHLYFGLVIYKETKTFKLFLQYLIENYAFRYSIGRQIL